MSETTIASTETVQTQSEINAPTVSDRLNAMFNTEAKTETTPTTPTTPVVDGEKKPETPNTEAKTEPTPEELAKETESLKAKAKELGLDENSTKEQIAEAEKFKSETEWKLEDKVLTPEEQNDGTWKGLIESLGLETPADYSEEKGFEYFEKAQKSFIENEIKRGTEEAKYDRFSDVPEEHRAEAEMIVELMKTGQTIQKINEPFDSLNYAKSLDAQGLVRMFYENKFGGDTELVDLQMQKIIDGGTLDGEYKLAKAHLDDYEKNISLQRKQQIETFKNNQKVIQEQRVNKANLELKVALDRVPEFLGKKLPDNIKSQLLNELQSDAYRNMAGTPEQKVDYFLYNKFGKTAMKAFQDRVTEKVVVEHKQNIHNVPIKQTGSANRVEQSSEGLTEADKRIKQMYGS